MEFRYVLGLHLERMEAVKWDRDAAVGVRDPSIIVRRLYRLGYVGDVSDIQPE